LSRTRPRRLSLVAAGRRWSLADPAETPPDLVTRLHNDEFGHS
jgi:hypothetical protein